MSGGTDSSVAAILLQDAGYEVVGVTFRFYEKDNCTEYLDDARELCGRLGIQHIVSDQRERFKTTIIDYFISEYMSGHTPVPCTLCNNYLKWPLLRQIADEIGIYYLATGHYVQKQLIDGHWHITNGADEDKNQSFFLWGLPQDILERMVLPMGGLTKQRVREIAEERGFLKAAKKKDSLGVCFCPMDYRTFLRDKVSAEAIQKGKFVDAEGNFIAWHEGYPFYTIGQRKGLGIGGRKESLFIISTDVKENVIYVGEGDSHPGLYRRALCIKPGEVHWVEPSEQMQVGERRRYQVRIRYRQPLQKATLLQREDGLYILFDEPQRGIAAGQFAAWYDGDNLVGSGVIEK